ncbi:hypothetical protein [Streptomyces sp. NPDC060001]|uniref:hypothetical protein n=1 Tax=Streptomyces sp. NPDC060001 TaxID=3347032 RepID=UPI0036AD6A97
MIIITGPQGTDDERGFLIEMAGLLDAHTTFSLAVQWATVTAMYCLSGWESCPLAVADVSIGEAFGLAVQHLSV